MHTWTLNPDFSTIFPQLKTWAEAIVPDLERCASPQEELAHLNAMKAAFEEGIRQNGWRMNKTYMLRPWDRPWASLGEVADVAMERGWKSLATSLTQRHGWHILDDVTRYALDAVPLFHVMKHRDWDWFETTLQARPQDLKIHLAQHLSPLWWAICQHQWNMAQALLAQDVQGHLFRWKDVYNGGQAPESVMDVAVRVGLDGAHRDPDWAHLIIQLAQRGQALVTLAHNPAAVACLEDATRPMTRMQHLDQSWGHSQLESTASPPASSPSPRF